MIKNKVQMIEEDIKYYEKKLEDAKIRKEQAIEEEAKEHQGIVKFAFMCMGALFLNTAEYYCSLSEEERNNLNKRVAKRMFDKAVQGKLDEKDAYTDAEIQFMMEHLEL